MYVVIRKFMDKNTRMRYMEGAFFDDTPERVAEINSARSGPHLIEVAEEIITKDIKTGEASTPEEPVFDGGADATESIKDTPAEPAATEDEYKEDPPKTTRKK